MCIFALLYFWFNWNFMFYSVLYKSCTLIFQWHQIFGNWCEDFCYTENIILWFYSFDILVFSHQKPSRFSLISTWKWEANCDISFCSFYMALEFYNKLLDGLLSLSLINVSIAHTLSHAKRAVLWECLMHSLKFRRNKAYNRAGVTLFDCIDAILFVSLVI